MADQQEQVQITSEKLMAIIGMKEVENVTLREQIAFLMDQNAELQAKEEGAKKEKSKK